MTATVWGMSMSLLLLVWVNLLTGGFAPVSNLCRQVLSFGEYMLNYPRNTQAQIQFNADMHAKLRTDKPPIYVGFWKPRTKVKFVIDEACLCNWWRSTFTHAGTQFVTAEHAMMYRKAMLFNDNVAGKAILEERDPWSVKSIGRQVRNFNDHIWQQHCYNIVKDIVRDKFTQDQKLKTYLLSQPENTIFVEASPLDRLWGIGLEVVPDDYRQWAGYNLLGYAITEVFREMR
jgi:conserved hypothetical protein, ribA/ribD-fused